MIAVTIKILAKGDPGPAVAGMAEAIELETTHAVIIEGGMSSGKTSIGLVLRDANGTPYLLQTSLAMFDMLAGAVKGAAARFGEVL